MEDHLPPSYKAVNLQRAVGSETVGFCWHLHNRTRLRRTLVKWNRNSSIDCTLMKYRWQKSTRCLSQSNYNSTEQLTPLQHPCQTPVAADCSASLDMKHYLCFTALMRWLLPVLPLQVGCRNRRILCSQGSHWWKQITMLLYLPIHLSFPCIYKFQRLDKIIHDHFIHFLNVGLVSSFYKTNMSFLRNREKSVINCS